MTDPLRLSLVVSAAGGEIELEVVGLEGREAISELFSFTVDFVAEAEQGLPDDVCPGATASLQLSIAGEEQRRIHGQLERVVLQLDGDGARPTYRARLVPRAHRLTMVTTQQIFMDLSLEDIIRRKAQLVGLGDDDIVWNVLADDPKREFIVQYGETDLNLIARLAEHLGICFYFDHQLGRDRMVFADHDQGLATDDAEGIALSERLDQPDRIYRLSCDEHMTQSVYVVYDYNYRTPELALTAAEKLEAGEGGGIVECGCHVKTADEAKALAAIRAEELSCHKAIYQGESSIWRLSAGLQTTVEATAPLPSTPLLLTAVEHTVEPSGAGGTTGVYRNRFEAVRGDLPFRPQRRTPKPVITGILTAVVQGAAGSDASPHAMLDEHGRYLVQFHFDSALGKLNQRTSRPVRMAQPLAGLSNGMHFPLKPGVEVAVAFAGGDPDRPVILGALPNHTKPSVVTATDSMVNRIRTDGGITIQFGKNH